MRNRKFQSLDTNTSSKPEIIDGQSPGISLYERSREERIKENLERMQKLGLKDVSLKLKSLSSRKTAPKKSPSSIKLSSPLQSDLPLRRSSRLQNVTPVGYSEVVLTKREDEYLKIERGKYLKIKRGKRLKIERGKPEIYTEEHEKLLGNTDREWIFFVDGYGPNGARIYDQVKGKTCHQCRQKTLGYRTHCCKCNLVQGQFCGACLYTRYGEHVLETLENPDWICPVCRGICNCSLCRKAKGWPATGQLYKEISRLGYKSVAHYLIYTRRSQNDEDQNLVTTNQVSVKRSLPFSDGEGSCEGSLHVDDKLVLSSSTEIGDQVGGVSLSENDIKPKFQDKTEFEFRGDKTKRSLLFSDSEMQSKDLESSAADVQNHDHLSMPKFEVVCGLCSTIQNNENSIITPKTRQELKLQTRRLANELGSDSIGARVRQRRRTANCHESAELAGEKCANGSSF